MKYRMTLLALCLLLAWLGASDVLTFLRNRAPVAVTAAQLADAPPPAQWLAIEGGELDLKEAISASGTLDVDALLVPLMPPGRGETVRILLETRDPSLIEHFKVYHFLLEDGQARDAYLENNRQAFKNLQRREGMVISGSVAEGNRKRLMRIADEAGMPLDAGALMVSEGKTPPGWTGFLLLGLGLAGLARIAPELLRRSQA